MKHAQYFQCLCDVCDNVDMLLAAIKTSMSRNGVLVPQELMDKSSLVKNSVCSINDFKCLDRQCDKCSALSGARQLLHEWLMSDDHIKIEYLKWGRHTELVKGKDVVKMKKAAHSGPRWELAMELGRYLETYPLHLKLAMSQMSAYKDCKTSLKDNEALIIVDFAENFTCKQFAEAQSAYYARNSVTVHPMVILFSESSAVKRDSVIVISDDLKHDSSAVKVFVQQLADHVKTHYPHINHLIFWSDGAGCQYKSRQPMHNICHSFGAKFSITWNFYGSRHGKSEADGESAVVKNYLDRCIKAEQLTLDTAFSCYQQLAASHLATTQTDNTLRHFYFVDFALVQAERDAMSPVCAIPQVRKIHQVQTVEKAVLSYRRLSCYCLDATSCLHSNNAWKRFKYPGNLI